MFPTPADKSLSKEDSNHSLQRMSELVAMDMHDMVAEVLPGDSAVVGSLADYEGTSTDESDQKDNPNPWTANDAMPMESPVSSNSKSFNSQSSLSSSLSGSSSKGRNPFLYPKNDTVLELRPEEIRWFYKGETNKKWHPFIGYDSLRIECKYREIRARRDVGLIGENTESETERINIRGGLFEVDVEHRKCYPIYWASAGQTSTVMRGTWFLDGNWQPVQEGYADQIETEHIFKFEGETILDDETDNPKGPMPVLHNIKFKEFYVDWNTINKVYLHSETASSKFYRAVGNRLGLAKAGTRLRRGYLYEAGMDDKPPDITHLVFVIHGIGQKMDTGSIVDRSALLRETCMKMKEKYFKSLDLDNMRVEFLPVEWRSALKLDGDTVDSITPNKVRGLRTILNSSAMDILYYTSPLYRSEITQGLQTELNKLYTMFCARHPYFEASGGKVSLIGHSLGSVITYDIITGWNPIQLYDQYVSSYLDEWKRDGVTPSCQSKGSSIVGNQIYFPLHPDVEQKCQQLNSASQLVSELEEARKKVSEIESQLMKMAEQQELKTPTLKFRLENFFCLGSPLAVFLALRGVRPKGNGTQDHILPTTLCCRLFNIYHPSDPVAYRLEPLILKHYSTIMPLRIHHYDSTKKASYDQMPALAYAALKTKAQQSKTKETEKVPKDDVGKEEEKGGGGEKKTKSKTSTAEEGLLDILAKACSSPEPVLSDDNLIDFVTHVQKTRGWTHIFKRTPKKESMTAELAFLDKGGREETVLVNVPPPPIVVEEDEEDDDLVTIVTADSDDSDWIQIPPETKMETQFTAEHPDLEYRLDYQLKEGKMENSYLSALTSHTGYWENADVALFILSQIFPDRSPPS